MRHPPTVRRKDAWGRRSDDPFLRAIQDDPVLLSRISALLTVGMILFWLFLAAGLIAYVAIALL